MTSKKSSQTPDSPSKRANKEVQDNRQSLPVKQMAIKVSLTLLALAGVARLGFMGTSLYNLSRLFFGSLSLLVIPVLLIQLWLGQSLRAYQAQILGFWVAFVGLLLSVQAYFVAHAPLGGRGPLIRTVDLALQDLFAVRVTHFLGGGLSGAFLYGLISFLFSHLGVYLLGGLLIILGGFLMSPWTMDDLGSLVKNGWAHYRVRSEEARERRFIQKEERRRALHAASLAQLALPDEAEEDPVDTPEWLDDKQEPIDWPQREVDIFLPGQPADDLDPDFDFDLVEVEDLRQPQAPLTAPSKLKQDLLYKLPSIDLFAPDKPKNQSKEKRIVRENIKILEQTFASFGIKVTVERAEIGPSVTKYEIKPAVGVRVNRISNLADDLALALAAKDVRIEAPIPGKSLIGIEVPNSEIATVSFRELWEQSNTDPKKLLEVPLGKAVNGSSRSFDLARMPHILVAGSTGSGKSVAVNGIISSILMKARPDEVKFMMIDPKMVELSVYNDIPHLLIPVVTNPRKASKALQKVVDEMENRYELFSKVGVRNIAGYNAKVEGWNATSGEKQVPLPLLVVIVDELADLMMVASKEVEDAIIRLGQKARAAGIHMILATQRPSVDVISGLIKANVPSRIAFAVSSGTDSRTILDTNGAEKLLGRGDMLFKPIDENHPVRLQGSFISDDDVERIVSFIKAQADADYDDSFDPGEVSDDDPSGNGGAAQGDPLFEEAKSLIIETQKASASMLQRRLSIGFNRATDLLNELEEGGVIGPAEGTKPRKVLMTP